MSEPTLTLDPKSTALVLIDLQKGVVGRELAPHSAASVVANSVRLATALRDQGGYIVYVRVSFSADGRDRLDVPVDSSWSGGGNMPANWAELADELDPQPGDFIVTKRQWGAFYGTELDLQLRRRGIRTIVLAGIATNFGVESTARDAYELGYAQILVEDAMTSMTVELHEFPVKAIFPRLGRVRSTEEVVAALSRK